MELTIDMNFRMDDLGDSNAYLEVKKVETWLELGVGYSDSARRAFVTCLNRRQVLALTAALEAFAATME